MLPCRRCPSSGIDPLQAWGGEDEVFAQLLLAGETDAALTLAHACFSGAALTAALERALGSLAAQAARLQMREEGGWRRMRPSA